MMKTKLFNRLFVLLCTSICTLPTFAQTLKSLDSAIVSHAAIDSSLDQRINVLEKQTSYRKSGEDHFMVVGLTTFGFASSKTTNTMTGQSSVTKLKQFGDPSSFEFSPMFLWRHGDKFLMEFEPSFSNNGIGVNWADISYFAAPNLILRAGYFVLPFGTYSKREAAGWIDKLATDPMGIADMSPTDYGIEVEGGLPMGSMKMNYDIALTNSSQINQDGTLSSGDITNLNSHKTVTARLGLLPFSNSSLEIGVSGIFGNVGNMRLPLQSVQGTSWAFDLNYVKTVGAVLLNIKSQYNIQNISSANYLSPVDSTQSYTFNNHSTAGFAQCSIRPTGLDGFIKNFEIAGRYTSYNTPANSTWGANQHTLTLGLDYWLTWRSVLKLTYEKFSATSTASTDLEANTGTTTSNTLYLQFSIQL